MISKSVNKLILLLSLLIATPVFGEGYTGPTLGGSGVGITPANCSSSDYVVGVDSDGNLLCDSIESGDLPSDITISGGVINNTPIGGSTPSSGAFSTLAASGTVTLSGGTASRVVFTDGSKNLVYSSTSSVVSASLSDETGSGALVFGTSPTIGTPVISGGTIDGTVIGGTTVASGSFSTVLVKNGSSTILNAMNTDPDVFSGDLVQVQITANGGGTITGSADAYRAFRIDATLTAGTQTALFRGEHIQVKASGSAVSSGAAGIGLRAAHFACIWDSTGTADNCYGIQTNAVLLDASSSVTAGTVQKIVANEATYGYSSTAVGTGVAVNGYGYYINTPQNTSAGRQVTTATGLMIEDQTATGVTTAYAIRTGTGIISFGSNVIYTTGTAIVGANYSIGRDNDATNQLHMNWPTGAGLEMSGNDIAEFIFTSTDLNVANNTISNIGGAGTDFFSDGRLVIGTTAGTTGSNALIVTNGNHTAITAVQPALTISSFTHTLSDGTTMSIGYAAIINPPTYQGVAGGGTETGTDITTLYIPGPGVVGSNIANTNAWGIFSVGNNRFDGLTANTPQTVTVADDGAGTPALVTITPTRGNVQVTCNDVNNCNVTMSETGAKNGATVKLVNVSANNIVFADTGGVSETAGGFTAGQYDSITMTYQVDRWVEDGRSNN